MVHQNTFASLALKGGVSIAAKGPLGGFQQFSVLRKKKG
ncbi:hypothetical protein Z948_3535 [Sulfitobacter donghicola DSW-25 = KCTC 12864 = JCM 14565]|nr:hypothetical protein Z948_3535 [Sulfitobacter donghicola DSW-25 = KCTC 12864 = JCM 14565]